MVIVAPLSLRLCYGFVSSVNPRNARLAPGYARHRVTGA
jgi:cytochrome b